MNNNLGNKKTMAENIQHYLDINNKSRSELCEAINVPYTTLAGWLQASTYPRIDKIELMSNYFGISKADLVEKRYIYNPTAQSEQSDSKEKEQLINELTETLSRKDPETIKAFLVLMAQLADSPDK